MRKINSLIKTLFVFVSAFFFMNSVSAANYKVTVNGTENYDYVHQVLDIVNEERAKEGLQPLKLDSKLTEKAMIRAAEITDTFEHTRPNDTSCFTVLNGISFNAAGENIAAGQGNPKSVMVSWMNSKGHMENIMGKTDISKDFTAIGIGHINVNGRNYWVQLFTDNFTSEFTKTGTKDVTITFDKTPVKLDNPEFIFNMNYKSGDTIRLEKDKNETFNIFEDNKAIINDGNRTIEIPMNELSFQSTDSIVADVDSNGVIVAKHNGTTQVYMNYYDKSYVLNVQVVGYPEERKVVNDFEVHDATLEFKADDKIKFTGKTNNKYYNVVEEWTNDKESMETEYSDGRMDTDGRIGNFKENTRYHYSVVLEIKDEYKDLYKFEDTDKEKVNIKLNGKDYEGYYYISQNDSRINIYNLVTLDILDKEKETVYIDTVEIKNATLKFKNGDKPVFTGKPVNSNYSIIEEWEEYYRYLPYTGGVQKRVISIEEDNEFYKENNLLIEKFESAKRYNYSLEVMLEDNDDVIYKFPTNTDDITVVLNGKKYKGSKYIYAFTDNYIIFSDAVYFEIPFEVNNVTDKFEKNDYIKFTGTENSEYYDIVEYWTEVSSITDFNSRNGLSSNSDESNKFKNNISKFEPGKEYSYSLRFNMNCADDECREYYLLKDKEIKYFLNGKEYSYVIPDENYKSWFAKDIFNISIPKENIPITSIDVDKEEITLLEGETANIKVTINPDNTTDSKQIKYVSNDTSVVEVSNGLISAKKAGKTTIIVSSSNGLTKEISIVVNKKEDNIFDVFFDTDTVNLENSNGKVTLKIEKVDNNNDDILTNGDSRLIELYNIYFINGDNSTFENPKYTVRIPIDFNLDDYTNISLGYINDGNIEIISSKIVDKKYIEFETNQFSYYGIYGIPKEETSEEPTIKEPTIDEPTPEEEIDSKEDTKETEENTLDNSKEDSKETVTTDNKCSDTITNPNTVDGVQKYIIIGIISLIGLLCTSYIYKNRKN